MNTIGSYRQATHVTRKEGNKKRTKMHEKMPTCRQGALAMRSNFRCVCLAGYEEVGGRCRDIDECNDRMVCGTDSECQVGFMFCDHIGDIVLIKQLPVSKHNCAELTWFVSVRLQAGLPQFWTLLCRFGHDSTFNLYKFFLSNISYI